MHNTYLKGLIQWLSYLENIHVKPVDLGLSRVRLVLDKLKLKQDFLKFVIGGTNGKGSTGALLESILYQSGYKVGLYSSPHLIRFNERARINGSPANDSDLIEQFEAIEYVRGNIPLTYFEFTTLAILRLFSFSKLDVAILEIGLGGRLDAVNIVDAECSVITNIGIDHREFLGHSREEIGWEKSFICRKARPIICGDLMPPNSLIKNINEFGADLWLLGRDFSYTRNQQQWNYIGRMQKRSALAYPALRGEHQLLNASLALAALESTKSYLTVHQQAVRQGLSKMPILGRFQVISTERPIVVLDVAHNPHATTILAKNLDRMGYYPHTYAVIGAFNDKDIISMVKSLDACIDYWVCVNLPSPRSLSAEFLATKVSEGISDKSSSLKVQICCDPVSAFVLIQKQAKKNDRIVVFGSFLTVSPILSLFTKTSWFH